MALRYYMVLPHIEKMLVLSPGSWGLLWFLPVVNSCSCMYPRPLAPDEPLKSPSLRFWQSPLVFVGTVISVKAVEEVPGDEPWKTQRFLVTRNVPLGSFNWFRLDLLMAQELGSRTDSIAMTRSAWRWNGGRSASDDCGIWLLTFDLWTKNHPSF